jgi:hypothetical protein
MSAAVPLNNPTYNPVIIIYPHILFGNKVLTGTFDRLSIDINNNFTPKSVTDAILTSDSCSFIQSPTSLRLNSPMSGADSFINGIVIADLSGNPYFYSFEGFFKRNYSYSKAGEKYFTCRLSIDDDGNILLSEYNESNHTFDTEWNMWSSNDESNVFLMNSAGVGKIGSLFIHGQRLAEDVFISQSIILYSSNGFIHLKKKANGIQVESTALSLPRVGAYSSFINKDNYLYYLEGSSIKRLYLASGETPEVVYSNSRLLTSGTTIDYLTASGSNLIFYQYADDNVSVDTYSLAMYQQGATPRIMATSSVDVRDIIELDF